MLISRENLILSQLYEFAKIRAQPYFLSAYRPCFTKIIILILLLNFPSRKVIILMLRRNIINTYRRYV
jgi:hypothetical protein